MQLIIWIRGMAWNSPMQTEMLVMLILDTLKLSISKEL